MRANNGRQAMDHLLVAGLTPAFVLVAYGSVKTRSSWRSLSLWAAFFAGAGCAYIALVAEIGVLHVLQPEQMDVVTGAAVRAFFGAALPEESAKLLALLVVLGRASEKRRVQDVIMLALTVSMGFAGVENLLYITGPQRMSGFIRAVTAVPAHGMFGLAMGSLLAASRLHFGRVGSALPVALGIAVLMHTAYDFPLMTMRLGYPNTWEYPLLLGTMTAGALLAITLSNQVLADAAERDPYSAQPTGPADAAAPTLFGTVIIALIGPGFLLLLIGSPDDLTRWLVLFMALLPMALGLDLLATGRSRRNLWLSARIRPPPRRFSGRAGSRR